MVEKAVNIQTAFYYKAEHSPEDPTKMFSPPSTTTLGLCFIFEVRYDGSPNPASVATITLVPLMSSRQHLLENFFPSEEIGSYLFVCTGYSCSLAWNARRQSSNGCIVDPFNSKHVQSSFVCFRLDVNGGKYFVRCLSHHDSKIPSDGKKFVSSHTDWYSSQIIIRLIVAFDLLLLCGILLLTHIPFQLLT